MTTLAGSAPIAAARSLQVALVGNPNSGKTTLFNRLTGTRQRTGNYPGVTVEKKVGRMMLGSRSISLLDLPGTYSLAAASADERIVVDVLTGHAGVQRPDAVVCVVDATNLIRHLFLASQVADTGVPIVIALNMIDAARERGIAIDTKLLSERLGVPVVATVASRGQGNDELRHAIDQALEHGACLTTPDWPEAVTRAEEYLHAQLPADVEGITRAELQRMLFDHDSAVADRVGWSAKDAASYIDHARRIVRDGGHAPYAVEAIVRYARLAQLTEGVVTRPAVRKATGTESIDSILTHRLWGLVVFTGLMFGVFWSIYTGAAPMMDGIETTFGALGEWVSAVGFIEARPMLQSLIVDGMIAGVGSVVIFLPQILILFFFIALLEDTGYMARAAYLMDKLFAWCGLNGKSFVPLLSSYACAVPAIMGARTIDNPRARTTTVLIAPLMSCSARLPVYVLLIGAFIEPTYGATIAATLLFGMHVLGLAVAMPIAWLLNRMIFRVKRTPFVMEMPSYRVPQVRDVAWRMWLKGKDFLTTAGTVIFAMSVVIWALSYFPRPESVEREVTAAYTTQVAQVAGVDAARAQLMIVEQEEYAAELEHKLSGAYLEQSALGRMGKAIQPIFAPAGFDWKITVGVVGSFPAREVIIATLGILYNLGGDVDEEDPGLISNMQASTWPDGRPVFTIPVALAVMVFFALCLQCGATVAVMGREIGWTWAVAAFIWMTAIAWVGAVITYQAGHAIAGAVA